MFFIKHMLRIGYTLNMTTREDVTLGRFSGRKMFISYEVECETSLRVSVKKLLDMLIRRV